MKIDPKIEGTLIWMEMWAFEWKLTRAMNDKNRREQREELYPKIKNGIKILRDENNKQA